MLGFSTEVPPGAREAELEKAFGDSSAWASSLSPGREYLFPPAARAVQALRTGERKPSLSGGQLALPTGLWSHGHCGPGCRRWGRPAICHLPLPSSGCHSWTFVHLCPARMRVRAVRTLAPLPPSRDSHAHLPLTACAFPGVVKGGRQHPGRSEQRDRPA